MTTPLSEATIHLESEINKPTQAEQQGSFTTELKTYRLHIKKSKIMLICNTAFNIGLILCLANWLV